MSLRIGSLILICALLVACGGGAPGSSTSGINPGGRGSSGSGTGGGTSGGSGTSGSGTGAGLTTPTVITVSANQTVSGADIAVAAPSGANPNVIALGTVPQGTNSGSASNTGGTIAQGSAVNVLMFGQGLSATMKITITGPSDLTAGAPTAIQSTGNPPIPGISFSLSATPSASLGSRTVILQDTSNNVTTFTGGLQVIP